jgi:hypothetical protein
MAEAIAGETNSGPSNIANDNSKAAPAVSGAADVLYPVSESNFIYCLIPAAKSKCHPLKRSTWCLLLYERFKALSVCRQPAVLLPQRSATASIWWRMLLAPPQGESAPS